MKRFGMLLVTLMAALVAPANGVSQELPLCLEPDKVTVQSGEDVFSSGVTVAMDFKSCTGKTYAQLMGQPEQFWGILARNVEKGGFNTTLGGSFGHFQGALFVGPYADFGFRVHKKMKFTALGWPAWFPNTEPRAWKNDGVPNKESVNVGWFGLVGVNIGETYILRLSYAGLDFLDSPSNRLPGASFTMPVTNRFDLTASATWNRNDKGWLYALGGSWSFDPDS